ncbi:hypothetical protein AC579_2069, partial [Pseudocercospora musae]
YYATTLITNTSDVKHCISVVALRYSDSRNSPIPSAGRDKRSDRRLMHGGPESSYARTLYDNHAYHDLTLTQHILHMGFPLTTTSSRPRSRYGLLVYLTPINITEPTPGGVDESWSVMATLHCIASFEPDESAT